MTYLLVAAGAVIITFLFSCWFFGEDDIYDDED